MHKNIGINNLLRGWQLSVKKVEALLPNLEQKVPRLFNYHGYFETEIFSLFKNGHKKKSCKIRQIILF